MGPSIVHSTFSLQKLTEIGMLIMVADIGVKHNPNSSGTFMNNAQVPLNTTLPYKSVAGALIFTLFLGPIGLLYGSFWGGLFMIFLGLVVINSKLIFPILLLWIICCIWGVGAVESYNRKIYQMFVMQRVG